MGLNAGLSTLGDNFRNLFCFRMNENDNPSVHPFEKIQNVIEDLLQNFIDIRGFHEDIGHLVDQFHIFL